MAETTTLPESDDAPESIETSDGRVLAYDSTDAHRKFRERGDERVTFRTDGRQFRPFTELVNTYYDPEAVIEFSEDSANVRYHDPAKVALCEATLYSDALRSYELHAPDGHSVGLRLSKLKTAASAARYGKTTKDPLEVSVGDRKLLTTTTREYDGGVLVPTTDTVTTVDPDSVRQRPDPVDAYMDGLGWECDVPPEAFTDVVAHMSKRDIDICHVAESNGELEIRATSDDMDDFNAELGAATKAKRDANYGDSSLMSFDYVKQMAKALKAGKVTDLTVRWGAEWPVVCKFARETDDGTLYDGHFMQAPRIKSDD